MTTTLLLNVGLPRTGSLALHRFFQCLGICSHHYCCGAETEEEEGAQFPCPNNQQTCGECLHANLLKQQQPFRFCGRPCQAAKESNNNVVAFMQFDVESSQPSFSWFLPQHSALPLLTPRNNNNNMVNIWILPERQNATVWAQSVLHWHSVTRRLLQAFDVPYFLPDKDNNKNVTVGLSHTHRQSELFSELQRGIERSQNQTQHTYRREALERIYKQHLHKVQSFVEQHNHAKHEAKIHLVPLVVDDPQAGAHLLEQLEPLGVVPDPTTNTHACWTFDAKELDEDWKNLSLPF